MLWNVEWIDILVNVTTQNNVHVIKKKKENKSSVLPNNVNTN